LSRCVQVTDAALDGVRTSLVELYLQRNRLQTLPRAVLVQETAAEDTAAAAVVLRVVDLSSNPLGSHVDSLARSSSGRLPPTLTVLRLRDVGLARWPAALLRGLVALTTLDVAENRLTMIPAGSLSQLVRLERLDASFNRIVGVDPPQLTAPSPRRRPLLDLAGNPLDCTCSLAPLCRHLFPADVSAGGGETGGAGGRRRTSARCRTPAEWRSAALAEFCVDADVQCSTLPSAVLAVSLGVVAAAVAILVAAVVVCRRCRGDRRRRRCSAPAATTKAAAAAAAAERCRSDSYQFVDETSLTSSSNSSSAATTTSAVPPPAQPPVSAAQPPYGPAVPAAQPPYGPHHAAPPRPHGQDSRLLASARHWL